MPLECAICGQVFDTPMTLRVHKKTCSAAPQQPSSSGGFISEVSLDQAFSAMTTVQPPQQTLTQIAATRQAAPDEPAAAAETREEREAAQKKASLDAALAAFEALQTDEAEGETQVDTISEGGFDVDLAAGDPLVNGASTVNALVEKGVCVLRAGAPRELQEEALREAKKCFAIGQVIPDGRCMVPGLEGPGPMPVHGDLVLLTEDLCKELGLNALFGLSEKIANFAAELQPMIEDSALDDVTGKNRSIAVLSRCISDHPDFTQKAFLDNPMNSAVQPGPNNRRELSIYFFLNAEYCERDGGAMQVTCDAPDAKLAQSAASSKVKRIAPESDTMVVFRSNAMAHAVEPVTPNRESYALSIWVMG